MLLPRRMSVPQREHSKNGTTVGAVSAPCRGSKEVIRCNGVERNTVATYDPMQYLKYDIRMVSLRGPDTGVPAPKTKEASRRVEAVEAQRRAFRLSKSDKSAVLKTSFETK